MKFFYFAAFCLSSFLSLRSLLWIKSGIQCKGTEYLCLAECFPSYRWILKASLPMTRLAVQSALPRQEWIKLNGRGKSGSSLEFICQPSKPAPWCRPRDQSMLHQMLISCCMESTAGPVTDNINTRIKCTIGIIMHLWGNPKMVILPMLLKATYRGILVWLLPVIDSSLNPLFFPKMHHIALN